MSGDKQKSADFAKQVAVSMRGYCETLLAAIGDERGFFKDLAANGPGSSIALAERNKVNERYMREWLNGMVSAGYLSLNPSNSTYSIPPEHIPVLAQEFTPLSMGGMISLLSSASSVLPQVNQCITNGGGVDYSEYGPKFWQGLERHTGCNFENHLLKWISLLHPMVDEKLRKGVRVCDVGCGNGRALFKLSKFYPNSTFIGYDILQHAVQLASQKAKEEGITNLSFAQIGPKIDKLPSSELFDIVFVFDVVHDSADPLAFLKCLRASVKDDGIFICLDIKCTEKAEENPVLAYAMSLCYCMTTSLCHGGSGLGTLGLTESVMRQLCKDAGFADVRRVDISSQMNIIWEVLPRSCSKY
jgi:2-polyprenyl-3-methyl-5-hydroxy-6-metoxy-1,4-benzoquinol methylase